jgi:hypothetical protein
VLGQLGRHDVEICVLLERADQLEAAEQARVVVDERGLLLRALARVLHGHDRAFQVCEALDERGAAVSRCYEVCLMFSDGL